MSSRFTYEFEKSKKSQRTRQAAQEELSRFVNRLQLPGDWIKSQLDPLLKYVTETHLNIFWYDQKIRREKNIRNIYIIITLVLLFIMPILILQLNVLAESSQNGNSDLLIAQIAALVTGLLALHGGIAAWIEQRKLIGNFWEASADLKEALYDLEDKWAEQSPKEWTEKELEDFIKEIELGTKYAKRVVRKEKDQFFKDFRTPKFDLVGMLLGTAKKTEDLTEIFADPITVTRRKEEVNDFKVIQELEEDLLEAQMEVRQYQVEVTELRKLVDQRLIDLEEAESEEERFALRAGLRELQIKLERAEANLIAARAKVTSLITVSNLVDNI